MVRVWRCAWPVALPGKFSVIGENSSPMLGARTARWYVARTVNASTGEYITSDLYDSTVPAVE